MRIEDERFVAAEAVRIIDDVVVVKAWCLNPPGKRSTRVSFDVSELAEGGHSIVDRNLVAGWKCENCHTVLFGTCVKDLMHLPCCAKYIDVNECVAWLAGHAA